MKLEQRLAAAEAELAAIKAEMAKKDEWPKVGDEFFCVDLRACVENHICGGDSVDIWLKMLGNLFRTRQEAEAELEARKVIAELRQCEGYRPFVPDTENHAISVVLSRNKLYPSIWEDFDSGWQSIYFESDDAVESAIDKVGHDRIIKAARWLAMREV